MLVLVSERETQKSISQREAFLPQGEFMGVYGWKRHESVGNVQVINRPGEPVFVHILFYMHAAGHRS